MASLEASPTFLAKMRLSIEFASYVTGQRGGSRRGDRGVSVELVPGGGVRAMKWSIKTKADE